MELFYPSGAAYGDLCLIDTPGVNPGEEDTGEHRGITQKIIRESADAAVVLFPATRVFTSDFTEFLMKNASGILHRCAFVITMMDLIDEDERDEMIKYVSDMLVLKCSLSKPKIFCCAAEHVLNKKDTQSSRYWRNSFYDMEKNLTDYIISERSYIIAEQLTMLLEKLFDEMKQDLSKRQAYLQAEKDSLNSNSVSKLDDVLEAIESEFTDENAKEYKKQSSAIESRGRSFERAINDKITSLLLKANYSTVDNIISNKLPDEIKNLQNAYMNDINKSLKAMIKSGDDASKKFQSEFECFYKNLKALDAFERVNIIKPELPEVKSISFANFKSSADKENEKDKKNAAFGAGGGGTIGFMLGGPVGALIGAGLGAIATVAYSGIKWDEYRDEIEESAKKDVSSFVRACRDNSMSAVEKVNTDVWNSIDSMIAKHREAYGKIINGMIKEYGIKLKHLKEKQAEINLIKNEIDEKVEELESIKMNIKNIE